MDRGRARTAAGVGLASVAALALAGVWLAVRSAGPVSTREGPHFELAAPDGRRVSLAELRGRPVVVHFWGSWCPPCLEELPAWLAAAARHPELAWVAISLDETWEQAFRVFPRSGVPGSVVSLIDPSRKVADAFGSYQFPETYLLSKTHRVAAKWVGPQEWDGAKAREELRRLVIAD